MVMAGQRLLALTAASHSKGAGSDVAQGETPVGEPAPRKEGARVASTACRWSSRAGRRVLRHHESGGVLRNRSGRTSGGIQGFGNISNREAWIQSCARFRRSSDDRFCLKDKLRRVMCNCRFGDTASQFGVLLTQ